MYNKRSKFTNISIFRYCVYRTTIFLGVIVVFAARKGPEIMFLRGLTPYIDGKRAENSLFKIRYYWHKNAFAEEPSRRPG